MTAQERSEQFLVCRVGGRLCALPLAHTIETMRPLPVEMLVGAPHGVLGLSVLRGQPVPVVDLAALLGGTTPRAIGRNSARGHVLEHGRFVSVTTGTRPIALWVDAVLGIRALADDSFRELPPLFREANSDAIAAIATLDAELLLVLRSARMIPDDLPTQHEGSR